MSAERKIHDTDTAPVEQEAPLEPFALRQQVAERLAAHRSRRPRSAESDSSTENAPAPKSNIAAAVAERYSKSKSYHAYLAEEAERAVREAEETARAAERLVRERENAARQAAAEAEIAARNAEAVAQVQYNLLVELEQYAQTSPAPELIEAPAPAHRARRTHPHDTFPETPTLPLGAEDTLDATGAMGVPPTPPAFTVKLASDLRRPVDDPASYRVHRSSDLEASEAVDPVAEDPTDLLFLDEEIAFRQAPVFEALEPPIDIPGNLIEFPRQLVAPRRARPRLAEGPLREEAELQHHDPSQLRIFEVEAEQISQEPAAETSAPEWTSILLDAQPRNARPAQFVQHVEYTSGAFSAEYFAPAEEPSVAQHLRTSPAGEVLHAPLHVASLGLRIMAATVDLCIVLAAYLVFAAASVLIATQFHPGGIRIDLPVAAISSVGSIVLLGLLYQILCFTFSDATPGMRYARIGLCTFSDENPSRSAMLRRVLALALSSASLGMGLFWALLDDDRLGWHDRISRIYQRSY